MKKYKYYLICFIGLVILFYGAFNINTTLGMILWGIGIIISLIGVLLQITFFPNFNCPDCGAALSRKINKTKFIKHRI